MVPATIAAVAWGLAQLPMLRPLKEMSTQRCLWVWGETPMTPFLLFLFLGPWSSERRGAELLHPRVRRRRRKEDGGIRVQEGVRRVACATKKALCRIAAGALVWECRGRVLCSCVALWSWNIDSSLGLSFLNYDLWGVSVRTGCKWPAKDLLLMWLEGPVLILGKMDLRWGSKDKQEPVYKHWGSGEWTETGEIYCYLSTAHASKVSTKLATVSVKYSKAAASLLLFKPPTSISSMVFPK